MAFKSASGLAIIPMQDLLGLGSDARMNTPGTTTGNWRWRFSREQLAADLAARVHMLASQTDRIKVPLSEPG
jgi:4-alpha-glucanotransferase